ncbi:EAL domain-containing protein [Shewanella profunda]|uniref:EAL domain-containing protein n=1 Tax=Shewanella profunda TaxID=254793 RepID=UPI00200EAFEC|nr:EAL domain-containing protein [Shewanella profunda]MCL1091851.1 EAL domain-containing protein [Shewanella profunda]
MPNILLKIVFLVSILLPTIEAQELPIVLKAEAYGVPEGLSQSTVTSVIEDNDGYIWIGTLNGLNRFDGEAFKHFFANDRSDLSSSFVQSLLFDDHGQKLLVGTDNGLNIYNADLETFEKHSQIDEAIWSINENGNVYTISTKDKLIEIKKDSLDVIKKYENENFKFVKKAIKLTSGYIIRNHDGKVIKITNDSKSQILLLKSIDIEKTSNGIYALTTDGTYEKISDEKPISSILKENAFILKNSQVLQINFNNLETVPMGYLLEKKDIQSQIQAYRTNNYTIIPSLNMGFILIRDSSNIVQSLIRPIGNIWSINLLSDDLIATSDDSSNIDLFNLRLELNKKINTQIPGPKYVVEHEEKLFIGGENGLTLLDDDIKETIIEDGVVTLYKDKIKNEIFVATNKSDIYKIVLSDSTKVEKLSLKNKHPIFQILKTKNGKLLLATQGGLIHIDEHGVEKIIYDKDFVYCINESIDTYLFGTRTSIHSINKNTLEIKKIFSSNKPIYSIAIDDSYDFVASSINELVLSKNNKFYTLPTDYGSQEEYNSQSGIFWHGKFYFGGISGISVIDKNLAISYITNSKIKTNISELLIFNKTINIGSEFLEKSISKSKDIKLRYSDYPFTLKFNSPELSQKNIEYFYNLNGLSDIWITAKGTNSATYTNLSPGHYVFNVYGENPVTKEKGPTSSIKIYISPPWWSSHYAKLFYFIIFIFITYFTIKVILRRRETQRQIALSEERLKLSLWGSGDEMWDWDIETGNIFRSNIWGSLEFPRDGHRSGKSDEESNIHPMDQERVREALNKHFYGETDHFEAAYRVKGKDENWVWILDRAKIVERDEKDNALRMTGTIKNISQFKQKEEQLRLFEKAIENISEGMFILDNEYRFVEVNEACCKISLRTRAELIGNLLTFDLYPENFSTQIRTMLKQQGRWANEVEAVRGDNSHFHMELTIDAIYDELGELSHYVGVFSDISRRKQQEEELRKLTNNDLLTGLPNRSNLQVTLSNLVNKEIAHSLMVLDLDNFKRINDSLGHQVGDQLLKLVSIRIKSTLPKNTSIYRLGGDEFAIVLDKGSDISASAAIAGRVIEAFRTSFDINEEQLVLGLSIGIVLYPEDEQSEQALLRKADIAMYHAKSAGGNCYQFYSESLNQHAIKQLEIENLIREGLKDDLFEVYYQPKIDLKRGRVAGMEALVRLNHPVLGLIAPKEFIPLAEESGLIVEIGEIVLRKACFAAQKWREQGLFNGRVAVNLSSRQFALPDIQQRIESILRLTKLPACHLELEITEGTVIKQPEMAILVMQQLAKMGVSLALDDFGTGYSSLSYLKRFPIHTLKIDKAFVDDIDKSDRDLKMVDSIITIAHNMGLSVVGEGVEQTAQLNILRALNCEEIQGYIFSKAIKESEFTLLLQEDMVKPTAKNNII